MPSNALLFQSTRSAWSVTWVVGPQGVVISISIHTLRMERDEARDKLEHDWNQGVKQDFKGISIHTLRMERDKVSQDARDKSGISIHTLRMERDKVDTLFDIIHLISIHTLRMERDRLAKKLHHLGRDFNPHAPHGA